MFTTFFYRRHLVHSLRIRIQDLCLSSTLSSRLQRALGSLLNLLSSPLTMAKRPKNAMVGSSAAAEAGTSQQPQPTDIPATNETFPPTVNPEAPATQTQIRALNEKY